METNEISLHQFKVYDFLRRSKSWVTMKDAVQATGVARETVGVHLRRFVSMGIADQAEVWPGHRFRLSGMADKRNKSIIERFEAAREIFGEAARA